MRADISGTTSDEESFLCHIFREKFASKRKSDILLVQIGIAATPQRNLFFWGKIFKYGILDIFHHTTVVNVRYFTHSFSQSLRVQYTYLGYHRTYLFSLNYNFCIKRILFFYLRRERHSEKDMFIKFSEH